MAVQEFFKKLQEDLELQELVRGEVDESVAFMLDEIRINIIDTSPGFQLYAQIGPLPTQKTEECMLSMLRGNLFGQATKKAFLGLNEGGDVVVARLFYQEKPTYKDFLNQIEDFINVVDFWKNEIASYA